MRSLLHSFQQRFLPAILFLLAGAALSNTASAQCADSTAPVYSHTCSNEYFDSIIVSGASATSTVSVLGITSCHGTYINDYPYQGTTAPADSTVTVSVVRPAEYAAYLSVYIDWNNDGVYQTTELAGAVVSLSATTGNATDTFTVPASAVAGVHLHMRLMLSEDSSGAPCTASYGQTYDFFFIVGSGCTMPVPRIRPSTLDTISNCIGGTGVTLSATGVGISGTFTWTPATGLSATTGGTVTANPAATTIYTIAGTSTGTCTATFQDTVVVITTGPPADTISYAGSGSTCVGDSILLTGTMGADYTYRWYENGGPAGGRSPYYYATTAGIYTLVITAYGCTDTSAPVTISFYSVATVVITASPAGNVLYAPGYYATYQWYANGSPVPGATADSIVAAANGLYYVQVTDTNGCSGISNGITVNLTGIANINSTSAITVYPNPAGNVLHIASAVKVNATIRGMEGNLLLQQQNARDMDLSSLPPGVYIIELYDGNGNRVTQRVVKE